MPDDQAARKVQHREIGVRALFPADQQASIAIEPAMRPFDDPAPRPRAFTLGLALVPTAANPRHHADLPDMLINPAANIAQIQAKPRARRVRRSIDNNVCQRLLQQHVIVAESTGGDQGQRQTMAISKQAALDAPFAAVGRVRADFFPRQAWPSSSSRRASTNPSRSSRVPHTQEVPLARSARKHRRRSTLGTVDGPRSARTSPSHPVRPTACQCAATAGSHPSRPGQVCAADDNRADAVWAAESTGPPVPTSHCSSASHHHAANSSPCPPNRNHVRWTSKKAFISTYRDRL